MERHEIEFHVAELTAIRQEMVEQIRQAQNGVLLSLVSNAVIASWISTQLFGHGPIDRVVVIASWIPLALTVVAWLYRAQRVEAMRDMAKYVKEIEQRLAIDGMGWETFRQRVVLSKRKRRGGVFYLTNFVFLAQTVLSAYFGYYVTMRAFWP